MFRLVAKSLRAFIYEKKIVVIFLVGALFITDIIFLYNSRWLNAHKSELSNKLRMYVYDYETVTDIEDILMLKNPKSAKVCTEVTFVTESNRIYGMHQKLCYDICIPDIDVMEIVTEKYEGAAENKYVIDYGFLALYEFLVRGDTVYINNKEFTYMGGVKIKNDMGLYHGFIGKKEFQTVFENEDNCEFEIVAEYSVDVSKKELKTVVNQLKKKGVEAEIDMHKRVRFTDVLVLFKNYMLFFALIISLIMYGNYIDGRLRDYAIFRNSGISRKRLMFMYMMESLMIFTCVFIITVLIWCIPMRFILNIGFFEYGWVCLYGYLVLLITYVIINIPFFKRICSKSAMELYRNSRKIG